MSLRLRSVHQGHYCVRYRACCDTRLFHRYGTGGILVDGGWLRMLGSGHPKLTRNIAMWNNGRSNGFCLVADDAVGGFFALNGGAFGDDLGSVYYLAPETLDGKAWGSAMLHSQSGHSPNSSTLSTLECDGLAGRKKSEIFLETSASTSTHSYGVSRGRRRPVLDSLSLWKSNTPSTPHRDRDKAWQDTARCRQSR